MNLHRVLVRFASVAALVPSLVLGSGLKASAQVDNVLVGASGMSGIQLDTWAVGEIAPIAEGEGLRLSRIHFDACTAISLHNTGGSALVYAESTGVSYAFQGGESTPNTVLAQGESVGIGPVDYLTIVNGNSDPAYAVDLLVLSVTTEDSFVEVPVLDNVIFPDESFCDGVNADGTVTPTILAEGIAAEGGESLYIGSAVFAGGSTTDGWDLVSEGSSFNLLVLGGGMSVAGPNSGRAAWIGPGGVISSYHNEALQIPTLPFVNDGSTPVIGLVFGTVTGPGAVWLPAE